MIVTFGSLNADFVFEVEASPVAGQTIAARRFHVESGGKGANQAAAAARDGAEVVMVGAVGCDAMAETLLASLGTAGVDVSRVATVEGPTGCAYIEVAASGENRIVVAAGANALARSELANDNLLAGASSLLLQMECPVGEIEKLVHRAKLTGVRSILNLAPAILPSRRALEDCSMLVVNETEADALATAVGTSGNAADLRRALGCDIVRTLGAAGVEAATAAGNFTLSAIAVNVVDTTAAGDCFVGVLASALDRRLDMRAALARAVVASGLACTKRGAQASLPSRHETDSALSRV